MILITGATGHLGTAVIRQLLTKIPAHKIAAFARDANKAVGLKEKGVTVRIGSYDDADSLDKAMRGVEKVLLIASNDEQNRLLQHRNVVDAAKKAGVNLVAYTSRNLKDRSTLVNRLMDEHFQTEDYIRESGLNYALFRNALYLDVMPQFAGEKFSRRESTYRRDKGESLTLCAAKWAKRLRMRWRKTAAIIEFINSPAAKHTLSATWQRLSANYPAKK